MPEDQQKKHKKSSILKARDLSLRELLIPKDE
jgi:hypothetical protein